MVNHLNHIINHVFLPLELPQRHDENVSADRFLVEEVLKTLQGFKQHLPNHEESEWLSCIGMVQKMLFVRQDSGGLVQDKLEQTLVRMASGGSYEDLLQLKRVLTIHPIVDTLALHIKSQNAGLIIRGQTNEILFESFELSATSEAAMGAKGRLKRSFPGPSISISKTRLLDSGFCGALTHFLVEADGETPKESVPVTRKAGSSVAEIRDTVHPKLVTEMLTGILRAIGAVVSVRYIHKNTRDEVLWKDARSPWRRSPFWLLLRVALQTTLSRCDESHRQYKSFMIFHMSRILDLALQASLGSDLLFQMQAKIVGRLIKLDVEQENSWFRYTRDVLRRTQSKIKLRWDTVTTNADPDGVQRVWSSWSQNLQFDTNLSLCTLRPYLNGMSLQGTSALELSSCPPTSAKRLVQSISELPNKAIVSGADDATLATWLIDVESWVALFLQDWMNSQHSCQNAALAVAELMAVYKDNATTQYADNPEDLSLMVLTLMELWIALDTFALQDCHLLRDFQPGISDQLFEPLLVSKMNQMKRLLAIERYVARRNSVPGGPCVFRSFGEKSSFSVRYFEQSPQHQALHQRIQDDAETKRSQKILELSKHKIRYAELMRESNELSCEYVDIWVRYRTTTRHSSSCKKCRLKRQAAGMEIRVHEWPLPKSKLPAKSVVFELDVPYTFSAWRDTTFALLVDVFSPGTTLIERRSKKKKHPLYFLQKYDGLKAFVKSKGARIQLASSTKPFTVAHYHSQKVSSASQDDVCVNNGLQYEPFDSKTSRMVDLLPRLFDIREYCTLKLPSGPFTKLQFAINNTIHTSNEVLAAQIHCDDSLSLHEYYSFGTLRSGHRIQWYNIARELVSQTLNFNREETFILLLQSAWQAGPSSGNVIARDSHVYLEDEKFGADFLFTLEDALRKYKNNWQAAVAVRALVALAARLLSLSPHTAICTKAIDCLRSARNITLSWTRTLNQELHECYEERRRSQLSEKLLETALSCHGTFDVDDRHVQKLLDSGTDVADLTECMILIHDHTPAVQGSLAKHIRFLLRRSRRASLTVEMLLRELILQSGDGLDTTIRNLWQGYRPGTTWAVVGEPSGTWLEASAEPEPDRPLTILHYNLLSGSLLVNGSPLTRLPREYEAHPTYIRLLGKVIEQTK